MSDDGLIRRSDVFLVFLFGVCYLVAKYTPGDVFVMLMDGLILVATPRIPAASQEGSPVMSR